MQLEDRLGPGGDDVYAALLKAHEGLDDDQSHALNARLVLMLANAVGDAETVRSILAEARRIGGG